MDQLHDDSVTLVSVCAFFIAICTVVVSLRMYVRWYMSASGIDDYLFVLGLVSLPDIFALLPMHFTDGMIRDMSWQD